MSRAMRLSYFSLEKRIIITKGRLTLNPFLEELMRSSNVATSKQIFRPQIIELKNRPHQAWCNNDGVCFIQTTSKRFWINNEPINTSPMSSGKGGQRLSFSIIKPELSETGETVLAKQLVDNYLTNPLSISGHIMRMMLRYEFDRSSDIVTQSRERGLIRTSAPILLKMHNAYYKN
jgi:hypothetical protein